MLKNNEKFFAFLALGLGVVVLVLIAVIWGRDAKDPIIRIIDAATGGFLLALGSASNALFRTGSVSEEQMKQVAGQLMQQQADQGAPPRQVEVVNQPNQPVPTTEAGPEADVPPMLRENA